MKHTIELPDELDERLREYLRENPGETVESVIAEAVENKLGVSEPKDLSPLLELAGFVKELKQPHYDPQRPEDDVVWQVRDSRDA